MGTNTHRRLDASHYQKKTRHVFSKPCLRYLDKQKECVAEEKGMEQMLSQVFQCSQDSQSCLLNTRGVHWALVCLSKSKTGGSF